MVRGLTGLTPAVAQLPLHGAAGQPLLLVMPMQHGAVMAHGAAAQLHVLARPPLVVGQKSTLRVILYRIMVAPAHAAQQVTADVVIKLTSSMALTIRFVTGVAVRVTAAQAAALMSTGNLK